jgi:excisionase family DNA binding protein
MAHWGCMPIRDLSTHQVPYVSVGELANYWNVSRKQIYKQIDAGTLEAIRLGPRLFRIRTSVAREFEERARMRVVVPELEVFRASRISARRPV